MIELKDIRKVFNSGKPNEFAAVQGISVSIEAGKAIASVESVKASAEIYSPAGGKVVAVNKGLADKPESINTDPFGEAWMIQLEGGSAGDVMDAAAYEKYCEERAH